MAEESGSGNDIGLNIDVVLSSNLNASSLTKQTTSALGGAVDEAMNGITSQSKNMADTVLKLQRGLNGLAKSSKSVRKSSEFKTLTSDTAALDQLVKRLAQSQSPREHTTTSNAFSNKLAKVAVALEKLMPKATRAKSSKGWQDYTAGLERQFQEVREGVTAYNRKISSLSKVTALPPQVANPLLQGLRVDTTGTAVRAYTAQNKKVEAENGRFISKLEKQNKTITELLHSGRLGKTSGIAFDIETANSGKNGLWSIASKGSNFRLGTTQRDLKKDKVRLAEFNKRLVQNSRQGGVTLDTMIEEFYGQMVSVAPGEDLKGQLPLPIGHNVQSDILGIRNAAANSKAPHAKELKEALDRYRVGGDSHHLALKGDTATLFTQFMKNEMGYTGYKGAGERGGAGASLSAVSAAFGYNLTAHDPASDTNAADFLHRLLTNAPEDAKKLFNKKRWLEEAKKATFDQEFKKGITAAYGKENLHLFTETDLPPGMEGAEPLGNVRAAAEEAANKRFAQMQKGLQERTINVKDVDTGRAAKAAMQGRYNEAAEKAQALILNSVDRTFKNTGSMPEGKFRGDLTSILTSGAIDEQLNQMAGAFGGNEKEQAKIKDQLVKDIVDSYTLMGVEEGKAKGVKATDSLEKRNARGKKVPADADAILDNAAENQVRAVAGMADSLTGIFTANFDKHKKKIKVQTPMQNIAPGHLRISSLAQTFNDQNTSGGYQSIFDLEKQFRVGASVPDLRRSMTGYGDILESKIFPKAEKLGYKFTKTNEEQLKLTLAKKNGESIVSGSPDGYAYNTKTGQGSLVEVKYRGKKDLERIKRGEIPQAYVAQASAYALASGQPNLPLTILTSNLEAKNAETDRIDKLLKQDLTPTEKLRLSKERAEARPKKKADYRVGEVVATTVMPDKEIQAQIKQRIMAITGEDFDPKAVSGLSQEVITHLAGGKKVSAEELNKALSEAAKKTKNYSKSVDNLVISTDNLGKAERAATPKEAGVKTWSPNVSSTKQEQLGHAEKMYEAARKKVSQENIKIAGFKEFEKKKRATGLTSDTELANQAAAHRERAEGDLQEQTIKAQALKAQLGKMYPNAAQESGAPTPEAEFRMQLQMEKEALLRERAHLKVKLTADEGKYATDQDLQRAAQVNDTLHRRHDVKPKEGDLTEKQLGAIAQRRGLTRPSLNMGGGGGKGRGGKDFVQGAVDLLDWQIQWMAGVTVLNAISGAFKNSIGYAVQFEAALKNIQLITQANTFEMDELEGSVSDLASSFQYSALELGQGLVVLGQAGFDATESLQLLPAITALATATLSDLKTATDITTTALKAFNLPVAKAAELSNVLAAMTIESKLDIEKLGTSFNYIASTASAAGASIEETGTAMGLMSNAGVRASTIGTSLRSMMGSLLHPTKKFEKALAAVGLSIEDVSPKYNSLGTIFKTLKGAGFDVESAFEGLDKRIAGGAITLVESADQFDSFQASITGTNRAFDMANKQMDTFQAQSKRMASIGQLIGAEVFMSSLEPLKDAEKIMNSLLELALAMSKNIPSTFKAMGASMAGLTVFGSLAKGVGSGVTEIFKDVQSARMWEEKDGVKAGSTLTGRNKQVYSMYTTFFDPKVLAWTAAITVAVTTLSKMYEVFSGKLASEESTAAADRMTAYAAALDTASTFLKEATGDTLALTEARKQLKDLGVIDFSRDSLDAAKSAASSAVKLAKSKEYKEYVNYHHDLVHIAPKSEKEIAEEGSAAREYLISQNKYWSGSDLERTQALQASGLDMKGVVYGRYLRNRQTDLLKEDSPRFQKAEASKRLAQAREAILAGDQADPRLAQLASAKQSLKRGDYYGAASLQQAKIEELTRQIRIGKAKEELKQPELLAAAAAYEKFAASYSEPEYMSGTAKKAKLKLSNAKAELITLQGKRRKLEALSAQTTALGGENPYTEALSQLELEVKAVKVEIKATNRKVAIKDAMAGKPRVYEKLTHQYMRFLTGKEGMDKANVRSFKGIKVSSLNDTGKALIALKSKQNIERTQVKEYFDGQVPIEVETALNLKFKLQDEATIQAQLDKDFAPIKKVYEKLIKQMVDKSSFERSNLQSGESFAQSQISTAAFKQKMAGLAGEFTYGGKRPSSSRAYPLTQDNEKRELIPLTASEALREFDKQGSVKRRYRTVRAESSRKKGTAVPWSLSGSGYGSRPTTLFGGYNAAQIEFEAAKKSQASKRNFDAAGYQEQVDLAKAVYAKRRAQFESEFGKTKWYSSKRGRAQITKGGVQYTYKDLDGTAASYSAETNLTKEQKARLLQIELEYSKKVVAISRSRRKSLEDDLKSVQTLAEKQAGNVNAWKGDREGMRTSFSNIQQDAKELLNPRSSQEKRDDLFRDARRSKADALLALQSGNKDGAKAASQDVASKLAAILNDPEASKQDIRKAKNRAKRYSNVLGEGYDINVNKAEASLSDTNGLLEKLIKAVQNLVIDPSDAVGLQSEEEKNSKGRLSELEKTQLKISEAMIQGGQNFADTFLTAFQEALPELTQSISLGIVRGVSESMGKLKTEEKGEGKAEVKVSLNTDVLQASIDNQLVNSLTKLA